MDSESNYDVKPINHHCSTNKNITQASPNGSTAATSNNIQHVSNQHKVDSQYDNVNDMDVKPMYGGNIVFEINFKNKIYHIKDNNEINAIKKIIKNKNFKKDCLLEIFHNKKSMYIIKANKTFKQIH